jgi:hypothetical protein
LPSHGLTIVPKVSGKRSGTAASKVTAGARFPWKYRGPLSLATSNHLAIPNPNLNADNAISGLRNSYRIQTDEGNEKCRSGDRPRLSSSHGSLLSQATACVTVSRRVRRSRWSQCTDAPVLRERLGWYTVGLGRGMFCVGRVSYCECRQGVRSGSKCRGCGRIAFFGIAQIMANSCQSGQRRRVCAAAGCSPGGRGPARWDQGRLTFCPPAPYDW